MTDAMARRLLMERVIERGVDYLREVLQGAGVNRISDLTHTQLVAIVEERDSVA